MHPQHRQAIRIALAGFLSLCIIAPARCQTSANLTLVSAYTARGVSLDTRPALQLRVEHDASDGWYAGAFASPVRLEGESQGQLIAYGGRAQRLSSTVTWDTGVTRSTFPRDSAYNYTELYAGLAQGRTSARLFYSPDYYGAGRTFYLDLSSAHPLGDGVSLAIHAGLLHPFGASRSGESQGAVRNGADLRLALAGELGEVRIEAGMQAQWHPYLAGAAPARALTVSASRGF
jgi:uncharacterized protein (TIGR02001 family)